MPLPPITSPDRQAVMDVLRCAPSGHYAKDIAAACDLTVNTCSKMLQNLRTVGHIGSIREGVQGAAQRVRYFVPEHEKTAMAAHDAGRGVVWGLGRASSRAQRVAGWDSRGPDMRKNIHARMTIPGEAVKTRRTKITIAPTPVDTRFVPTHVEPFFTAMRPGEYLSTGSAIERAYGGDA